jgi:plastocyanin
MYLNQLRPFLTVSLMALAFACGGHSGEAPAAPPANAKRVDQSKTGNVTGRVTIDGTVPSNPAIQIDGDPYCRQQNPNGARAENFAVDDGGLENVFVYVKDGLGDYWFDVPTEPVKLDQHACRYQPHVLGVRAGQKLAISNSDDTPHNVHALATVNRAWNKGQSLKNIVDEKVFTKPEVMVQFKCDVHNWMHAYVGVLEHPYFAVTRDGGKFALKDLPAGTYTVEAWHEKLGTQTQTVTLGEKESKELNFTFKSAAAPSN